MFYFCSRYAADKCYVTLPGAHCHYKKLKSLFGHLEVGRFKQNNMMI